MPCELSPCYLRQLRSCTLSASAIPLSASRTSATFPPRRRRNRPSSGLAWTRTLHPRKSIARSASWSKRGESIYAVDAELLASLAPDLIVTQDLCHVCAASPDDLATALTHLPKLPQVLTLTPHSIDDVWQDIIRVGDATGTARDAAKLISELRASVCAVESTVKNVGRRPRVLCLEWLDPYYVGGHWVPEMVARAGGVDVLGVAGKPSFRVSADDIAESSADMILVMQCGYNATRNAAEFRRTSVPKSWQALPALRDHRIFALDANSYFSRPGPRLAEGVHLLAHLFHPALVTANSWGDAFQEL